MTAKLAKITKGITTWFFAILVVFVTFVVSPWQGVSVVWSWR